MNRRIGNVSIYPNPFNSSAIININNSKGGEICIYNAAGQEIRKFEISKRRQQENNLDATDMTGNKVSSGIYLVKYLSLGHSVTRKLIYTK